MSHPITYSLFLTNGKKYQPVVTPDHLNIQSKIRAADLNPRVSSATSEDLNEHVGAVPWPFPIEGYLIQVGTYVISRWDPAREIWVIPPAGASNIYKVYKQGSQPDDAELFLQASVEGSQDSGGSTDGNA